MDLGKWASTYFTSTGFETTKTPFHIKVKDCPASVTNVAVLFDGARDQSDNTLLATTGGAAGVAIKLYEDDKSTAVSLGKVSKAKMSLRARLPAPALPTSSFSPTISPPVR